MIIKELLRHQWLKTVRAPGYYKNLIVNIFLGFFMLYMLVALLGLGFVLRPMCKEIAPHLQPIEVLFGALFFLFLLDLAIRYFMQPLNTLNLPPYQILPIRRNKLVNYLVIKPLFNPINYLILLPLLPFLGQSIFFNELSVWKAISVLLIIIFAIWFNILFASFLKRRFGTGIWGIIIVLATLAGVATLEYFHVFSFFDISRRIFSMIANIPIGFALLLLPAFGAYALNRWFFAQNYYPERFNKKIAKAFSHSADFSFMQRFGKIGELIALELKLILRHKRTKSILMMSVFFLAYGLLFYPMKTYQSNQGLLFFVAMFVTGIFMLMYGQWIISWDGSHFDFMMTKKIDTRTYIRANYYLLVAFNIISFVLTTPYFFFGIHIVYLHLAAFVYNLGVNTLLYLLVAPYNTKRLDLSKGSAMNYQGTTYKNFLYVLPMLFFPLILVSIFGAFGLSNVALIFLASVGMLGIIFHKFLLDIISNHFLKRKYALCEGFRKKE